ncbi:hypothetical protein JL720_269 [Aureococcus anophagefferens]|nr:hypothetical protein JL720_269 [Aureococcus anophagefferens]
MAALCPEPLVPPLVDVRAFHDAYAGADGEAARAKAAAEAAQACRSHGLLALPAYGGIDAAVVDAAFESVEALFALPLEKKLELEYRDVRENVGYIRLGNESPDPRQAAPDPKEVFQFQPGKRKLPPSLERPLAALFKDGVAAGKATLRCLARAVGSDDDAFSSAVAELDQCSLRAIHYPGPAAPSSSRCGAHSDFGFCTLLLNRRGGPSGLQAAARATEAWRDVVPPAGAADVFVNIGDMLARRTNDELCKHLAPRLAAGAPGEVGRLLGRGAGRKLRAPRRGALGAVRTSVFCRRDAGARDAEVDVVYCGLGGLLANKGAAAVRFKIRDTSLLFVGAHLAAHAKQADKRNRDFHRINSSLFRGRQKPASDAAADAAAAAAGLPLPPADAAARPLSSPAARRRRRRDGADAAAPVASPEGAAAPPTRLIEAHDRVVFAGDLNYRLAAPRGVVDDLLERSGLCPAAFDLPRFQHYDTATRAWVDYDLADARIMDDALRRGAAAAPLAFAPGYEARFGANAVSARMPTPPPSGVVQVNAETGNTRVARRRPPAAADASALDELRALDELPAQIRDGKAFVGYAESPLAFAPTYKVDVGAAHYDTSPKRRVPAWTDRVLFSPDGLAPYEYDAVPAAAHSDHRPVFAKFAIMIE